MNSKLNIQQQMTNGLFIRKEIQRFESVHPNIYSIYDLIDTITDFNLQQQIREHIVNIEDSFVNSQEWTLSRGVPDIKLGILGSVNSGKSALVHRFLTGTYMQEESPEGGRFKKEVVIDGQSYLLLIRDEGGAPEMQFTHWVDAVIFVFSLENEESFQAVQQFYLKMTHYRNMCDVPFILVGTQDFINETNPRCIDDTRARNLANELKRCIYYETCATYGLHVERVFHDACQKVVHMRTQYLYSLSVLLSSQNTQQHQQQQQQPNQKQLAHNNASISTSSIRLLAGQLTNTTTSSSSNTLVSPSTSNSQLSPTVQLQNAHNSISYFQANSNLINSVAIQAALSGTNGGAQQTPLQQQQQQSLQNGIIQSTHFFHPSQNVFKEPLSINQHFLQQQSDKRSNKTDTDTIASSNKLDGITPCSTPNQKRKDTNRRRSNIFTPNKKEDKNKLSDMGIGRSIPIKQDYMEDVHGKEIDLQKTTIKMPGANKPRIGKPLITTTTDTTRLTNDINSLNLNGDNRNGHHLNDDGTVTVNSTIVPSSSSSNGLEQLQSNFIGRNLELNSKKRHRRIKSTHKTDQNKDGDLEEGGFEFIIVSLDNKQWHFEAATYEEREEWVQAIEQQILSSLQSNETNKFKNKLGGISADNVAIQAMKNVPGNNACVDCDSPNPVWATLNYGALICIECSGIHRNLGTHLSRVRSLELDDWSNELIQVMTSIGNKMINSIFEANCKGRTKPNPNSHREEKEKWIRAKYETKQLLAPIQNKDVPIGKQLIDAVTKQDVAQVILLLSHCKPDDVNSCISTTDKRTSLHIAASMPNTVLTQLLIWYGADVDCLDNNGRNALSYAKSSNSSECIQLLLYNGSQDLDTSNSTSTTNNSSLNSNNQQNTLSRRSASNGNNNVILEKLAFNVL